jgi:hypothetical protein
MSLLAISLTVSIKASIRDATGPAKVHLDTVQRVAAAIGRTLKLELASPS